MFFGFNLEWSPDRTEIYKKFYELNGINKNPDQIFFVTDGVCMSAAGYLANALKQNKIGTFIGLGRPFEQICAVPGGCFIGYAPMINSIYLILSNATANYTKEELDYLRSIWLPHDGDMFITAYRSYSYDDGEPLSL